jgi:excinuclease ABC subunit C
MLDADGQLIYVGKAKRLVNRLLSYFSATPNEKAGRIAEHARRLVWEPTAHEFIALVRELELIRRFLPRFNSRGRPRRRSRLYLAVTAETAPRLLLAHDPPADARAVHGPLRSTRHTHTLARLAVDQFRLRTCPEATPPGSAPRCLRRELGLCSGPCAGGQAARDYARQVQAADAFLAGRDTVELQRLETAMREAAAAERFELAAVARNAWTGLSELQATLRRVREVRNGWRFVYPVRGRGPREFWFLIDGGQLVGAIRKPYDAASAAATGQLLDAVYTAPPRPAAAAQGEDADMLFLLADWFRRYPAELRRTLTSDAARRVLTTAH